MTKSFLNYLTLAVFSSTLFGVPLTAQDPKSNVLDPYKSLAGEPLDEASELEKLTFSGTQQWGERHLKSIKDGPRHLRDWKRFIVVPDPPSNTSARTKAELDHLVGLKKLRTPEKQKVIEAERASDGLEIGEFRLGGLPKTHPKLNDLIVFTFWEVEPIVMSIKFSKDRVRPSFLRPGIEPTIDLPVHSAYPSGHSTMCHCYAYVLADVMPQKIQEFEASARSVAINREIAGVHYVSDSAAGRDLAKQIYDLLKKLPEYQALVKAAKEEVASKKN